MTQHCPLVSSMSTEDAFSGLIISRVPCFVSGVLLVYDHLCTLDNEVKYVWKRKSWNFGTVLFFLNRYIPYIYISTTLFEDLSTTHSLDACKNLDLANTIIVTLGISVTGAILCLRTWAIWERRRLIGLIFVIMALVNYPVASVNIYFTFKDTQYSQVSPEDAGYMICFNFVKGTVWVTITFIMILVTETLIAGLTLVKAVEARHSSSKWVFKVHYMGIIYYLYILAITITNIVVSIYLHSVEIPSQTFFVLQGVVHSVLANRVIFIAREPSEFEDRGSTFFD